MNAARRSERDYARTHLDLFNLERAKILERLLQIQAALRREVTGVLSKKTMEDMKVEPYWMSPSDVPFFHTRLSRVIDAVNGVVERTYGSSGQGEKDETLVRVQQEFRERNLRNDERRLLFLLQGVSYDTKEMSFTPLELERLTLDLDGNGHARGEVVTPGELLSKRVLVPHKELINYWHEKSIPMRLYPIGHCMNQRISLKRTGCDDASASALYTVGIYHGDGQYALHLPMSVSVSQDQEDLWLAMLDDNLRELVQRPLSHYAQDPLVTTQQGTMKMPLVSVEEEGSVRRFEVTCLGAGVRTFNQRVLTAEDRRSLHFSAAEVAALSVTEPVHPLDPPETYPWDLH